MKVHRQSAPLPPRGSPGQVLGLDGAGKLAWLAMGSAGGGTPEQRVAYSHYRLNITAGATANANPALAELSLRDATTGARVTGGVGAGDAYASYTADKAFDGDPATFWISSTASTGVLTYSLTSAVVIDQYSIQSQASGQLQTPTAWTFEGSNDGAVWTILHTVADAGAWTVGQTKTYTI